MIPAAKNIGLYFGTFNPIHNGHLTIANHLLESTDLEEIWFVVSPQSPFKSMELLLDDKYRYQMVLLATENNSCLYACNIEFTLSKPSYTINTLAALHKKYPEKNFALIMGSDNLESLQLWKKYEDILNDYLIYVYPRHRSDGGKFISHPSVCRIEAPLIEISSTTIRKSIKQKKNVGLLLPAKVVEYINKTGIYK